MEQQIAVYGLLALAGATLLWCLYQAGKSSERASQAQQDLFEAIAVEEANNELEDKSREAANRAIDAGASAGPAPDSPDGLSDEVRARIFRRKG